MKEASYIRSTNLIGFRETIGLSRDEFEKLVIEAGLSTEALDNLDSLISFGPFCRLCELLANRYKRPNFGLETAITCAPYFANLGPMVLLSKFVSNLEEYLQACLRYWHFHSNAFTLETLKGDDEVPSIHRLKGFSYVLPPRHFAEGFMANVVGLSRTVTGRFDLGPNVVRFQHSRLDESRIAEEYFKCPVEYDSEHTELEFETSYLKLPTQATFTILKPLVSFYVKRRIERTSGYDQSAAATVELAIPSLLGSGRCNIETIAESMGLATKQLQRLLHKEGTTFSDILERVRERLAREMLATSDASVGKIAGLLDYAGNPPFTLAFERWTGVTPLKFRQSERQQMRGEKEPG